MKTTTILVICALVSVGKLCAEDINRSLAYSDAEIDAMYGDGPGSEERKAAFQRKVIGTWIREVEMAEEMSPADAIPMLGKHIWRMACARSFQVSERILLYDKAKAALLAIPGHAEYFGREVKRMMDDELAGKPVKGERHYHFQTLEHLPSLETVKVLGDLLNDERNKDYGPPDDCANPLSNATLAVETLESLGLRNRPMRPTKNSLPSEQIPAWKRWFEQARAGARKISFEGDPREYSLKESPTTSPQARPVQRPDLTARTSPGGGADPAASPGGTTASWLIASFVVLAAGIAALWFKLRHRP